MLLKCSLKLSNLSDAVPSRNASMYTTLEQHPLQNSRIPHFLHISNDPTDSTLHNNAGTHHQKQNTVEKTTIDIDCSVQRGGYCRNTRSCKEHQCQLAIQDYTADNSSADIRYPLM